MCVGGGGSDMLITILFTIVLPLCELTCFLTAAFHLQKFVTIIVLDGTIVSFQHLGCWRKDGAIKLSMQNEIKQA